MNKFRPFTICFLFLLVVACSNETDKESVTPKDESKQEQSIFENKVDSKLVASEKRLPANFYKIAPESKLVYKVETQTEYEEVWSLYNLEQQIPKVDFEASDIYFIGVEESGSCPYEVKELNIEKQVLNIHLSELKGRCTLDATSRTFVIEVEKETSSDLKNVVFVHGDIVSTAIPIKRMH